MGGCYANDIKWYHITGDILFALKAGFYVDFESAEVTFVGCIRPLHMPEGVVVRLLQAERVEDQTRILPK